MQSTPDLCISHWHELQSDTFIRDTTGKSRIRYRKNLGWMVGESHVTVHVPDWSLSSMSERGNGETEVQRCKSKGQGRGFGVGRISKPCDRGSMLVDEGELDSRWLLGDEKKVRQTAEPASEPAFESVPVVV